MQPPARGYSSVPFPLLSSSPAALILIALIITSSTVPAAAQGSLLQAKAPPASGSPSDSSGRILVALSKEGAAATIHGSSSSLNSLTSSIASAAGSTRVKLLRHINIAIVESTDVALTIASLGSNPNVMSSGPDSTVEIAGEPNDAYWGRLWGMEKTEAPAAWDITTGSSSVVVCVIDNGVNYLHPDLADNMWVNPGEIPGNGIDDDENGFVDDVHGINAIDESGDPMGTSSHGTHCAGILGARGNNTIGVVGMAPEVSIMACKFTSSYNPERGAVSDALTCLDYAVGMGVPISLNSWGGGSFDPIVESALDNAGLAGHLFIAAAGNDADDNDIFPYYPASYSPPTVDAVMSVASVTSDDMLSYNSHWGSTSVDLAAPGRSIRSCSAYGGYTSMSGTSMAASHVAGAAALLLAHNPDLTNLQIKQILIDTCTPAAPLTGIVASGGILNARAALTGEVPDPVETPYGPPRAQYFRNGNDFDLSNTIITFSTPPDYAPCVVHEYGLIPTNNAIPVYGVVGETSVAVEFGSAFGPFTFYNVTYDRVFVGSNGYLTFGEQDDDSSSSPSLSKHNRLPRVSALYSYLMSDSESMISYVETPEEFIITYDNVRSRYASTRRSTFQVTLMQNGAIRIALAEVNPDYYSIVGLSSGTYSQPIDFSHAQECGASSVPTPVPATTAPPPTPTSTPPPTTTTTTTTTYPPTFTTTPLPGSPAPTPVLQMFWPGTPFDLAQTTLTFRPDANMQPCLTPWTDPSFPHSTAAATQLPLTDDSSQYVAFTSGFVFPLFGQEYSGLFVGSNGYLTFATADDKFAASVKNHHSQPRISALYTDLTMNAASSISYEQVPDAFVVTFDGVHEYGHGTNGDDLISFQIKLTGDGGVAITYLPGCPSPLGAALVGLSSGDEEAAAEAELSSSGECPAPPPADRMTCPIETPVEVQWVAEGAIATCPGSGQTVDCVGGYFVVERLQAELFAICTPYSGGGGR